MKGKVFIVDDDPILGNLLEARLAEMSFKAEYFSNSGELSEKILRSETDENRDTVIISEVEISCSDAYELHRQMRRNPETASIPFIFLSSEADLPDEAKEWRIGADSYIRKPFKMENILSCVENSIERAAKARAFQSQTDFSGDLAQMSLDDIVQIAELNHKSGELVLTGSGGGNIGRAFFLEGRLMAAQTDTLEGEDAFYELMQEDEGHFDFYGGDFDVPQQITLDNRNILLNASRLILKNETSYDNSSDDGFWETSSDFPERESGDGFRKIPGAEDDEIMKAHLANLLDYEEGGEFPDESAGGLFVDESLPASEPTSENDKEVPDSVLESLFDESPLKSEDKENESTESLFDDELPEPELASGDDERGEIPSSVLEGLFEAESPKPSPNVEEEIPGSVLESLFEEESPEPPLKAEHKDEFSSEALDSLLDEEPPELPLKDDVDHKDEFSSETLGSLLDEEPPELPLKDDVDHKDEFSSETLGSLLDEEPPELPLKDDV
ncbi:DUF4388 domain-containing protein, partial [Desulfococcaceae bacterium HSG8]|nr:DUF4388 domain-containing protein [Desulfococcaceae bacterium HSG8]